MPERIRSVVLVTPDFIPENSGPSEYQMMIDTKHASEILGLAFFEGLLFNFPLMAALTIYSDELHVNETEKRSIIQRLEEDGIVTNIR